MLSITTINFRAYGLKKNSNMIDFEIVRNRPFGRLCCILLVQVVRGILTSYYRSIGAISISVLEALKSGLLIEIGMCRNNKHLNKLFLQRSLSNKTQLIGT